MSALNYSIGDNRAYNEKSADFMASVQNNATSIPDAMSAISKPVSDQATALNTSASQLQALY